ncbi:redox-sensitive transcriptional activator SoxR [Arthrobacter sp. 35W]|uniref:redox-sensitive transcriptional activator SoxR n=1 Tax=Arthrobacter sp. 35W TaxID=1132441 RepID=UPI00041B2594|nr:redox-sensitive transcriptional activator SoxR [Arthrobacter sp. 35W]
MESPAQDSTAELTVGQLSARSGVAVSALHFYERKGLIRSHRTGGNQRRYDRSELRRVAIVRAAQRAGVSLATVAEAFAELPADGVPEKADWQRLSARWRSELDARIEALQKLRGDLGGCIGCGCLSLADCGFVNPNDAQGSAGPGARAFDAM